MDVFLIDGMEIIFRLAVAILALGKEDLLSLDMEGMLKVGFTQNAIMMMRIFFLFSHLLCVCVRTPKTIDEKESKYACVICFPQYFQKEVPSRYDSCPDALFAAAYNVKYSARRIKKLEKDYIALKSKEQEDQEEVRVSRQQRGFLLRFIANAFILFYFIYYTKRTEGKKWRIV